MSTRLIALAVALIFVPAVGCKKPTEAAPKTETLPPINLATEDVCTVVRTKIATGPRVSGTLKAREHAVLRAELGGTVTLLGPDLGDPVKKGDLLARIESKALGQGVTSAQAGVSSAQANVVAAQAKVDVARREVARTEALVKGGASPARDLDNAQSNLDSAIASLSAARAGVAAARSGVASASSQLGDSTVRSPIDGVVLKRDVNKGDVVQPGASLYEIIVPSSMRLEASVSSEDLGALENGRRVDFEVRGYGGQQFEGTISRIAPAADPVTRQIAIIVEIPNPGGKLIAGLYAEGRISSEEREALVIPENAIDSSGDRPSVMHLNNGAAERVSVTIGLRDDVHELVEITQGLVEGELVILNSAARTIEPGAKVAPPGATKPAAPAAAPAKPADKPVEPAAKPAAGAAAPPAEKAPAPAPGAR